MKLLKRLHALNLIALVLFSWTFQADGSDRPQRVERKYAVGTGAIPPIATPQATQETQVIQQEPGKQSLQRTEKVQRPNTYGILKECNPHLCTQATCGQVYQFLSHCYGCVKNEMTDKDWFEAKKSDVTFSHCKAQFCANNPGFCHEDLKNPLEGLTLEEPMATLGNRRLYICMVPLVGGATESLNIDALNSTDFLFLSQTDERLKGTLENLIEGFIHFEKLGVDKEAWIRTFDHQNNTRIDEILRKVSPEVKLTPEEVGQCALLVEHIRSTLYHKLQIPVLVKQSLVSGNKTIPKTISQIGCGSEKL